jgi:hypothetical protein
VEASGALTVKSVPQGTWLFAPRTNIQPKCAYALNILGCSERVPGTSAQKFSRYSWQTGTSVSTFLQPCEGTIRKRLCLLLITNKPHTAWSRGAGHNCPETQPSVGPLMSLCSRCSKTLTEEFTSKFSISRRFKNEGSNSFKYLSQLTLPSKSIGSINPSVHTVLHNRRQ